MADLAASIGSCCTRCSTCSAERSSRKSRRGPAAPPMRMTLFGDTALLVEDEPAIDAAVNARILAISELVRGACVPGVRDVVPAFASFAVHFDPECTDVAVLRALVTRLIDDIPAADVE